MEPVAFENLDQVQDLFLEANCTALVALMMDGAEIIPHLFAPHEQPHVIGAIAALRDAYPIRRRWVTLIEQHRSEARLRAAAYRLAPDFIKGARAAQAANSSQVSE